MDLSSLSAFRRRRLVEGTAVAPLAGLAAGLALVLLTVAVDAAAGIPPRAVAAGLLLGVAAALAGVAIGLRRLARGDWSLRNTARVAAARAPDSANALATLLEPAAVATLPPYVLDRVRVAAEREAAALDPRRLASLRLPVQLGATTVALALMLAAAHLFGYDLATRLRAAAAPAPVSDSAADVAPAVDDAGDRLAVTITPPAYTGLAPVHLDAPTEISAPAGAKVDLELRPGRMDVEAGLSVDGAPPEPMRAGDDGRLAASFSAREDGSVAVRPTGPTGDRPPILLPLRVVADRAPEVQIVAPKGDVLVDPAVRPRTLAVEFEATDDYGVAETTLRYIRSTGEGDAAEFVNGEVAAPIVAKRGGTSVGRAVLDLDKLGVVAGASLVYHVEARDRNAVTGPSTGMSESLVFEVAAPKPPASITLGELRPEDLQRFLLSERIILEHTLKLEAERPKLAHDVLVARSSEIAAEQRDFKESFSQFIEIRGDDDHDAAGPLRDEKSFEAAQRHGADDARAAANDPDAAGKEAHEKAATERVEAHNHGKSESDGPVASPVRELQIAVSAMWDAESALGVVEPANAIPHEKTAIEHLKRAQRAVRYFPRVKVKTKPIDLKRRYAGDLADVKSRVERIAARELSPDDRALRDALGATLETMKAAAGVDPNGGADDATRATDLGSRLAVDAERLLAIKGGFQPALVAVAARLSAASAESRRLADALRSGDDGRSRSAATAVDHALTWSAGQLASLLDARAATRGSGGAETRSGDRRASAYFRRLAGGR